MYKWFLGLYEPEAGGGGCKSCGTERSGAEFSQKEGRVTTILCPSFKFLRGLDVLFKSVLETFQR
jgi:hypothetical protein